MPAKGYGRIPSSTSTSIWNSLKNAARPQEAGYIGPAMQQKPIESWLTWLTNPTGRVIKIKSMTTEETGLNRALETAGISPVETDLAELIVQLGHDKPSHIVVPALHKNRHQVRELFSRTMDLPDLGERPEDLAEAARLFLRRQFLSTPVAISGANFLIAETGGVCIVESEGNGRMCLTLPRKLISIAGIDKIIPRFQDLEVMLQVLPRSATGERMNPYNSVWTGVHPGDGPEEFHIVLLDNRRTEVLRDPEARETLHCIRCGACQNACPVYRQTGGHAYGSVYAGPIGAILTPQLAMMERGQSLPYASSLCGACFEVCPVKINIPEILIHLRGRVVTGRSKALHAFHPEAVIMRAMQWIFSNSTRFSLAQRVGRIAQKPWIRRSGWIEKLPSVLGGWTRPATCARSRHKASANGFMRAQLHPKLRKTLPRCAMSEAPFLIRSARDRRF